MKACKLKKKKKKVVILRLPRRRLEDFYIILPLSFSLQCLESYFSDEPQNFRISHYQLPPFL